MILTVKGEISHYYVQTLCMIFFPGEKFSGEESENEPELFLDVNETESEISVSARLVKGDKVQVSGFGSFEVKAREARVGRNPRTKETIQIPATRLPAFKASKALKDAVAK